MLKYIIAAVLASLGGGLQAMAAGHVGPDTAYWTTSGEFVFIAILGGTAQGIGTALYEEMPYDAQGQPLASTLSDYMLPGPAEVPEVRILHMETPSPYTRFGQKGIGEGGAIAPPAAIANAISDALADLGAELLVSPITPRRIVEAIARATPPA